MAKGMKKVTKKSPMKAKPKAAPMSKLAMKMKVKPGATAIRMLSMKKKVDAKATAMKKLVVKKKLDAKATATKKLAMKEKVKPGATPMKMLAMKVKKGMTKAMATAMKKMAMKKKVKPGATASRMLAMRVKKGMKKAMATAVKKALKKAAGEDEKDSKNTDATPIKTGVGKPFRTPMWIDQMDPKDLKKVVNIPVFTQGIPELTFISTNLHAANNFCPNLKRVDQVGTKHVLRSIGGVPQWIRLPKQPDDKKKKKPSDSEESSEEIEDPMANIPKVKTGIGTIPKMRVHMTKAFANSEIEFKIDVRGIALVTILRTAPPYPPYRNMKTSNPIKI